MIKIDESIRKVFKNGSKYMTISIVGSIINIVMMKYYTNIFSKAEYGIMSFYLSFFYFMLPFISLGIDSSFERIYYDYKDDNNKKNIFLSSVIILMMGINAIMLILCMIIAPFANSYLSGSITLYITVIIATIACSWENFYSKINIIEQNSKLFFKSKLLYYILGNVVSIAVITFVMKNIEARFIGLTFGYLISIIVTIQFYRIKQNTMLSLKNFDVNIVKEVIKYSLPVLVTVILSTSFAYVDKIFIRIYYDFSNMAEYSVGQNIGKILSLVIESLAMAGTPYIINNLKNDYENTIKKLKKINLVYIVFLICLGSIIICFNKPIIAILSSKEYINSAHVFIFMVMTYIVAGAYKIPSIVLMYHKRVKILPVLGMINLISNIVFNQLLVRKYGIGGVAFASYLSMLLYSFANYIFASRYIYNKKQVSITFLLVIIISLIMAIYLN